MNYYGKYSQYNEEKFLRLTGLTKSKFADLIILFQDYTDKNWSRAGKPGKFTLADKLLITFRYLRDYPTFMVLGLEFGISESFAQKIFTKISLALINILKLPNLKCLEDVKLERVIIDVSEQKTERPKKNNKSNIQEKPRLIQKKP